MTVSTEPQPESPRSEWLDSGAWATLIALPLLAALAVTFALLPGFHLPSLANYLLDIGLAESIAKNGLLSQPTHLGNPAGVPVIYGAPLTYFTALIIKITGATPVDARTLAGMPLYIVSFASCYILFRKLGMLRTVAVVLSFAFFANRFLWGHLGYGPIAPTFALLPAFALLDLVLYREAKQANTINPRHIAIISANVVARTLVLLMEGYCFVIWLLLSTAFLSALLVRKLRERKFAGAVLAMGTMALFIAVPYFAYAQMAPASTDFAVMPADFFRAQGIDLTSLLLPAPHNSFLFSRLGLEYRFDPYSYFGDGSNQSYNYIGIFLLFCGLASLACIGIALKKLAPLLVAGCVAFLLSMGPSLKIASTRPPNPAHTRFTSEDYLMPPSATTLNLGTDIIYQQVPGIRNMRAIYRWLVLPKLIITAMAGMFITWLVQKRQRALALMFIGAITLEAFPPIDVLNSIYKSNHEQVKQIETDLIEPLRQLVPAGSKIVFVSQENDYLATYLAPRIDLFSYNTGGDKFQAVAAASYPPEIRSIMRGSQIPDAAHSLMTSGQLDAVVLPFFNLRWDSYRWPPSTAARMENEGRMEKLLPVGDPRFLIQRRDYFFLITPVHPLSQHNEPATHTSQ